jgi:hypothetical protein
MISDYRCFGREKRLDLPVRHFEAHGSAHLADIDFGQDAGSTW